METIYQSPAGPLAQHFDASGALARQQCISCRQIRPFFKYPERTASPTGRGPKCNSCRLRAKRARRAERRREAYAEASK
ncbi:NAD-dependent SIR2 family protein deacetylase [Arthrobacter sp. UYCu511]|uniref:hypothetical protein n=1 Tax=Arthrobacter sp. UYCu511 TaxID=3156337 RepID=UPI003394B730